MKYPSEIIKQTIPLNKEEVALIDTLFKVKKIKKGDFWIKEGKYCNEIAFISKGTVRIFYEDESGNEVSCFFMPENNFVSSFTSFLTRTPTKENIQAINDVELYTINRVDLDAASIKIPKLQIFRRVMAENLFILMERRIAMLQSTTAQERYEDMIKENGNILLEVPLQYVASFLGISPQHLSRLRKKK